WSRRYAEPDFYSRSPFLSRECCRWLVEKGVRVLGMDTPSPDNPADDREAKVDSPNHKILLGGGASLVEYLCNLDQITSARVELIALPIKIQGGDGAPARVVAVEYED
ncbi:MAG: cyclase family protein, partial [Nitrospinales bacterium]